MNDGHRDREHDCHGQPARHTLTVHPCNGRIQPDGDDDRERDQQQDLTDGEDDRAERNHTGNPEGTGRANEER